jgi:hypothetical protein
MPAAGIRRYSGIIGCGNLPEAVFETSSNAKTAVNLS